MLKEAIAEEIAKAEEAALIRLRDDATGIAERFVRGELNLITTNWDLTLESHAATSGHPTCYIHGNIRAPGSLYLPTEAIVESYRADLLEEHDEAGEEPTDRPEESTLHGDMAAHAMLRLQESERLIVWGLSLSPLDPELGIVFSDGFHGTSNPNVAVIVDKNPEGVRDRLRFYLPNLEPYCFHPTEL